MNKKTIDGVREYYKLPDNVTNEQIAKACKGSLGEAVVNIGIVKQELIKAFGREMPKIFNKYFKKGV